MRKVYIVDSNWQYDSMFRLAGYDVVNSIPHADLVCFTGGEDVTPALYGDFHHNFTYNNVKRDEHERSIFYACVEAGIPMVGICRGAQLLNVLSGGRMYQHIGGHTNYHDITDTRTKKKVYVSSTHHQMMMPGQKANIIAVAEDVEDFREWYNGTDFKQVWEANGIEVVHYDHTQSLCFQPHPEYSVIEEELADCVAYFFECVEALLFDSQPA